ncbi:helix-turn-helix domain-containing protein [Candidatus Dojkabacteria bacterium]|nr:helix-turn-helix domain-containing protein [Candidatus Dojkabacteria bacterium]
MSYQKNLNKAVKYIEDKLCEPLSLDKIADIACLSPYHLLRVFKAVTGETPGEYIRIRRLTLASKDLVCSNDRIIDIALKYQFSSQEAFTRSFRNYFDFTPAKYRVRGKDLVMMHKKALNEEKISYFLNKLITMKPKIITKDEFKIVGIKCKTTLKDNEENKTIPKMWQEFIPRMKEIENRTDHYVSYGVCLNNEEIDVEDFESDTEYEYMCAVEVENFDDIPEDMLTRTIPKQKYAVFTHRGSLSNLSKTYDYIYGTWASKSEYQLAGGDDFELYDDRFTPQFPQKSEMDIYVPIK